MYDDRFMNFLESLALSILILGVLAIIWFCIPQMTGIYLAAKIVLSVIGAIFFFLLPIRSYKNLMKAIKETKEMYDKDAEEFNKVA